jgi:hypothetical protein
MDSATAEGKNKIVSGQAKLARLCISLPRDLYKQVKMMAHDENTTISALMIEIIRTKLKT